MTMTARFWAWSGSRTNEGHREYKVTYLVDAGETGVGPAAIYSCPGLPLIGSSWGPAGDVDAYALCQPDLTIEPFDQQKGEPYRHWKVTFLYSTKANGKRCQDAQIEDPLAEPDRYGGSFARYTEQALKDKDGVQIRSLSGHPLAGPNVEFDANRPTVWIEQNRLTLDLSTASAMVDRVNGGAMWGLNKRCVKLANFTWERKIKGSCEYYYTRRFEFDIRYDTFDKEVEDWSEFVLDGEWKPGVATYQKKSGMSVANPDNWVRYQDRGHNFSICPLTEGGIPATSQDAIRKIQVKKYGEANFASLGIPMSF